MIRFTLVCDHGTRTVEYPNEEPPSNAYAMERIFALQPRCPYCDPLRSEETFNGPSVEQRIRNAARLGVAVRG